MEAKSVCILMSTYNGVPYLQAQLDSLFNQRGVRVELLVRDDGSSDDTRSMLEAEQREGRLSWYGGDNRGPAGSFLDLLLKAGDTYDFYAFADQDDVWRPTKLADCVQAMMQQPDWECTPVVVATDLCVVDDNLNTIADSFWRQNNYSVSLCNNKYFHLVYNNIPGCSMLFNRAARAAALAEGDGGALMHDSWLVACTLWGGGRVVPLEQTYVLYRQHQKNVLGSTPVPSYFSQVCRFRELWRKMGEEWSSVRKIAHIGFCRFVCVKMYYMIRLHLGI